MNKKLLLEIVQIWWTGFKVLCRWSAFFIVLTIFWLPSMGLTHLIGNYAGDILGIVFFVFIVPIVFYLTSQYLLLLGDNGQDVLRDKEISPDASPVALCAGGRANHSPKKKIMIGTIVVFVVGFLLGPPDLISQYVLGIEAAFICCVALLILAGCKFVKSSPNSMHTLVCILVCMVSVLAVQWPPWLRLQQMIAGHIDWPENSFGVSSSGSFGFGNLWIGHSSKGGTDRIVCSVDSPRIWSYGDSTWKLTFQDSNSVEVIIKKDKTVWIDKQHRITSLGPILSKEDVLLMRKQHEGVYEISSPDELLDVVNELKAEHAASASLQESATGD